MRRLRRRFRVNVSHSVVSMPTHFSNYAGSLNAQGLGVRVPAGEYTAQRKIRHPRPSTTMRLPIWASLLAAQRMGGPDEETASAFTLLVPKMPPAAFDIDGKPVEGGGNRLKKPGGSWANLRWGDRSAPTTLSLLCSVPKWTHNPATGPDPAASTTSTKMSSFQRRCAYVKRCKVCHYFCLIVAF